MARNNNLPFEVGGTYFGGDSTQITTTSGGNLEGKLYQTEDQPGQDGSNMTKWLRAVRNSSGGRVVASLNPSTSTTATIDRTCRRRALRYGTTTAWFGRKIRGIATAKTDYGVLPDDQLQTSVAANDIFYVVERGICLGNVASGTTASLAMSAGKAMAAGRTGGLLFQVLTTDGTAERHPIGALAEAVTTGVTGGRAAKILVGGNFADAVA